MKKYKLVLIGINLAIVLLLFHYSVARKETIVRSGQLILLPLAPVDPRSLMQGDYMDLRYEMAQFDTSDKVLYQGYCVVRLDSGIVGRKVRLQAGTAPLSAGEYLIAYTAYNKGRWKIGAESYFFEEGQGSKFDSARYGGLRVDDKGNSILIGLYDAHKRLIQ